MNYLNDCELDVINKMNAAWEKSEILLYGRPYTVWKVLKHVANDGNVLLIKDVTRYKEAVKAYWDKYFNDER